MHCTAAGTPSGEKAKPKVKIKSLAQKITLSTVICILVVGLVSYSFLYTYLSGVIRTRAQQVEQVTINALKTRLDDGLEQYFRLCNVSSSDFAVASGLTHQSLDTTKAKRDLLNSQQKLSQYLASCGVNQYVEKLMVFNSSQIMVQALTNQSGYYDDCNKVMALALYQQFINGTDNYTIGLSPSIIPANKGGLCLAFIGSVSSGSVDGRPGWLYAELSLAYFNETLAPYVGTNVMVSPADTVQPLVANWAVPAILTTQTSTSLQAGSQIKTNGRVYEVQALGLERGGLMLYSFADVTLFSTDSLQLLVTVLVVTLTSMVAVVLLAVSVHFFVNKPLRRLTKRIQKISANDFSYDASIEQGNDEIAEVGKVVNEMSNSISHLLTETEEMYEQKKNTEIALLQSQINPHFLYNTLDSIHWMAVIQENPGIAKTVRSLSNLLRNMAKGVGDKIPLQDELALLHDYAETQKIRFMEMFEIVDTIPPEFYVYSIVKFTLQPLVENAIFHGLEPSGRDGTITLSAALDGDYLLISITDNGVGMQPQQLAALMQSSTNPHPSGMAGIGVANVHSRLRLTYGSECGLFYESEPGLYTKATVRILAERTVPDANPL